ncbi:MAG TPA: bifunctional (p)ppGpp synthetase/guanosine-3',5'-bis(diphosphate) 3'-pyrophosphohydrolase [Gemmatimonadaceae bacterium]
MTAAAERELIPGWSEDELPLHDKLDRDILLRAYRFSEAAHRGQLRNSGDPYITHSVEVAKILADLQLDSTTVASGLLHDVIEDTSYTLADVEAEFGKEVAAIVDGLTKIAKLPTGGSSQDRQVESYRKLLLSIAKDARVIIVKLADRLHNMRTLDWLPPEKRRRIAQETRDLYAPLAHRFGMAKLRWELEDLAFKHLESDEYKALARQVSQKRVEREALVKQMADPLVTRLNDAGIQNVDVVGRPKHLWSIYKKMKQREKPYEEIYDLLAIRVLVNSVPDCYHALGVIHDGWTPVQERIKDYIAQPKSNGYQSLHTTVFGPGRQLYEVQIRTREMHRTADFGIAAHWRYKEDAKSDELDRHLSWFRQVLELQMDAKTPDEFLEFLKLDLYADEIFVFTPTGDVFQLPKGATPLDFAFAVHTEIGLHCAGARVNGRIAPLSRALRNSETVEIITSTTAKPTRDWLAHVRTGRARHKIRQVLKRESQTSAEKLGQEMLEREIKRRRMTKPTDDQLDTAALAIGLTDATHLLASIGQGDVNVTLVIKQLFPELEEGEAPKPTVFERLVDRMRGANNTKGVRIQGVDGLMVRYAQCCQPVPGDPVVGYVTRGRGVSIHRADCPNLLLLAHEPERRLEIDWQEAQGERFVVRLALEGNDRRGLYADVAAAVSSTGTDIKSMDLKSTDGRTAGSILVEVENLTHLEKIIKATRRIKGISDVSRRERLTADT